MNFLWFFAPYFSFLAVFFLSFRKIIFTDKMLGHNWDWLFPFPDFLFRNLNLPSSFAWQDFNLGSDSGLKLSHFFPDNFLVLLAQFLQPRWVIFCLFFLVLFIAFISFKKLLDLLVKDSKLNYIPSFLYAFSPFLFNDIIGGSWYMWLSYAFIPFYFAQLINFITTRKLSNLFFFLIISVIVISSLQQFILIEVVICFYLIYLIFLQKSLSWKKGLVGYFFAHFLLVIFNLYWLVPFIYSIQGFSENVLSSSFVENFWSVKGSDQGIRNIFSLVGYLDRNIYYYALPGLAKILFIVSVFVSWILVLSLLLIKKGKEHGYLIWLLILIILTVLIKGGNPPLSGFTMWIFQHVVLMRLYKSPQHLMFAAAFVIPLLISFAISYYSNTRHKIRFNFLFTLLIFVWISGWWLNGDLGHQSLLAQKKDYIDFYSLSPQMEKIYRDNEMAQTKYRVLFLPITFSVDFFKTDYQNKAQGGVAEYVYLKNPTFNSDLNPFAEKLENYFCPPSLNFNLVNYLSLFSVKEIVLRDDIYPSFTQAIYCWDYQKIKMILDSNPDLIRFLETEHLAVYRLKDVNFKPFFFVSQKNIYSNQGVDSMTDFTGFKDYDINSAIYLEKSNFSGQKKISKFDNRFDSVLTTIQPSFTAVTGEHDIQIGKELESNYQTVRHSPQGFLWQLALLKEKFFEWRAKNNKGNLLQLELMYANKRIAELDKFQNPNSSVQLQNFKLKIEKAIQLVKEETNEEERKLDYLKIQKTLAYNLQKLGEISAKDPSKKFPQWEKTITDFRLQVGLPERNPLTVKYQFSVPEDGDYTLLLDDGQKVYRQPKVDLEKWKLKVNDQLVTGQMKISDDDGWIQLGKMHLTKGSQNSFVIDYSNLPPIQLQGGNKFLQTIDGWQPDTQFYINGSAKLATEGVRFAIDEIVQEKGKAQSVKLAKELILFLKDSKLDFYMRSDQHANEARLYFYPFQDEQKFYAESKINEIKIFPLYSPRLLFKLDKPDEPTLTQSEKLKPKITFNEINPTKYKIKVEGAKDPYTLVFNTNFNKGWKVYGNNSEIATKNHYSVNGYANAWYIKPQDVGNQENYELIVEFWPQRLFYFGLFLSGLMIFGLLVVVAYYKVRRLLN